MEESPLGPQDQSLLPISALSRELRDIADTLRRIEHAVERLPTKGDVPR